MIRYWKRTFCLGLMVAASGLLGCARDSGTRKRRVASRQDPLRTTDAELGSADGNAANADETTQVAREWGIEVLGINLSAAGYMLDFRYRVIDPEKASLFASDQVKPYLLDQATGAKMYVPNPPKVGPLRQKSQKLEPGRICFILFANPGRFIKAGSKVTLAFGDTEFKDLVVNDPRPTKTNAAVHACEMAAASS